jgi:hypothetical protein
MPIIANSALVILVIQVSVKTSLCCILFLITDNLYQGLC